MMMITTTLTHCYDSMIINGDRCGERLPNEIITKEAPSVSGGTKNLPTRLSSSTLPEAFVLCESSISCVIPVELTVSPGRDFHMS